MSASLAEWAALGGVMLSAFLSATLLPGNSEIALTAFLYRWPGSVWWVTVLATLANTAGSATSLWLGRRVPPGHVSPRIAAAFRRYGSILLVFAWVPFVGDALPLAAGWLRLPWRPALFWLTLGKGGRYAILALAAVAWLH